MYSIWNKIQGKKSVRLNFVLHMVVFSQTSLQIQSLNCNKMILNLSFGFFHEGSQNCVWVFFNDRGNTVLVFFFRILAYSCILPLTLNFT